MSSSFQLGSRHAARPEIEPQHAQGEHRQRRDDSQTGRRKRRGAEELHRDGVLDRRRAGPGSHGEGEGAQGDRGGYQVAQGVDVERI
jgi:hypothetical protein